jgi:hypothetical protein
MSVPAFCLVVADHTARDTVAATSSGGIALKEVVAYGALLDRMFFNPLDLLDVLVDESLDQLRLPLIERLDVHSYSFSPRSRGDTITVRTPLERWWSPDGSLDAWCH